MSMMSKLFSDHPEAADETYFEHMAFAHRFSGRLFYAALAAFIHGLVPGLFETTASSIILDMNSELVARRAQLAKQR